MSDLKKTSARLERAVDRLDKALANGQAPAWNAHKPAMTSAIAAVERERDSLRADVDALRSEQARLTKALEDAQAHQAAARRADHAVAERLDDAIDSLRVILGV